MIQTLMIENEKGLHARASAKFVETVESFDAEAQVSRDGMTVAGNSIMGLMMLAASKGCEIEVKTTGAQKALLGAALKALLSDLFDEAK